MTTPAPAPPPAKQPLFHAGFFQRLGLALGLAVLSVYLLLIGIQISRPGYVLRTDFLIVLTGADILRAGQADLLYDEATQQATQAALLRPSGQQLARLLPFNHPPFEALLVGALRAAGVGPEGALAIWTLLNALAFAGGLLALRRAWPIRAPAGRLLTLGVLTFYPLMIAFLLGQNTGLLFLGWAGGVAALRCGYPGWAGAAFALATLKPQTVPVILLALLLGGAWRALLSYTLVGLVASVSAMPVLGLDWPLRYARFLIQLLGWSADSTIDPATMQNWRGLFTRLLGDGAAANFATLLATAVSLLALVGYWAYLRRPAAPRPGAPAWDRYWIVVLLIGLLVSPHVLRHDLTLALVPGWLLAAAVWGSGAEIKNSEFRIQNSEFNRPYPLAMLGWLLAGWAAGFLSALVPGAIWAPAVFWLAGTAGWMLWQTGRRREPQQNTHKLLT
jgi:hypothetical protein